MNCAFLGIHQNVDIIAMVIQSDFPSLFLISKWITLDFCPPPCPEERKGNYGMLSVTSVRCHALARAISPELVVRFTPNQVHCIRLGP